MMQVSIRPSLSFLVCLLLLSLSIVSCGGSGTTSPANNMTLKVAQNSNAFDYFPLYVAEQEHFFKAQGLTLIPNPPTIMGQANKTTAAMEADAIEVAAGTITDAFTLSRVNAYIKIIGTLSSNFTGHIIVSKRFEQQTHLTASSPLQDKVKALMGKKLGVPVLGSAMEALLINLFDKYGYNVERDATVVNLGASNPVTALGALSTGRVDAVAFPVPVGEQAEIQGIGDIFINPPAGEIPEMVGQLNTVLYTKQTTIDAKPQAVQALIRAIAQADTFIHNNPAQAKILLGKYFKFDQKTLNAVSLATLPLLPLSPQISQKGFDEANQFHLRAGLIAIALPYKNLVATDTINKALNG